ncbi:DMT family transporter [Zobellia russellii]|uniref:DMT family transporter n=1 Tax=Zobellia russellii TaxID=248907 RepID=UPI0037DC0963
MNGKGFLLGITAAFFWGITGAVGQFLFQEKDINLEWLITVRLLVSGILLLAIALFKKENIFSIWKNRKYALQLIIFSFFGVLGVQYTYFAAIKHSNAATATILQYLAPIIIAIYFVIRNKKAPLKNEIIAILLAMNGVFLVVTHGNVSSLTITPLALLLGISSAITLAIYTVQPKELLEKYNGTVVIGWGMLVGGIIFSFVKAPWQLEHTIDMEEFYGIVFIILFGSFAAFYLYLSSTKLIGAQKTSLLASAEPLIVVLLAITWLGTDFLLIDMIGGICIVFTILILSKKDKKPQLK